MRDLVAKAVDAIELSHDIDGRPTSGDENGFRRSVVSQPLPQSWPELGPCKETSTNFDDVARIHGHVMSRRQLRQQFGNSDCRRGDRSFGSQPLGERHNMISENLARLKFP